MGFLVVVSITMPPSLLFAQPVSDKFGFVILTNGMLKNAWSAMDQTYPRAIEGGQPKRLLAGTPLHSPDNIATSDSSARKMPWDIPNNFIVEFDSGITNTGGRAIIYTDWKDDTIMVSMMGTNGNDDAKGWEANLRDMASMQFITYELDKDGGEVPSLERMVLDKVKLLTSAAKDKGGRPKIVFVGDSKGGAQVQLLMATYLRARDVFPRGRPELNSPQYASQFVSNENLALVAHSAPGAVEPIRRVALDTDTALYAGIEMHYSFAYNKFYPEIVASLGSAYLGVGPENSRAQVVRYKTSYTSVSEMHRLVVSGYQFFKNGHDFWDMERTSKPVSFAKTQDIADIISAVKDVLKDSFGKQ